jgi:hypothetical protein
LKLVSIFPVHIPFRKCHILVVVLVAKFPPVRRQRSVCPTTINGWKAAKAFPPWSLPCTPSPLTIANRCGQLLFRCCVFPSRGSHPNWWPSRSLSFNFVVVLFNLPK